MANPDTTANTGVSSSMSQNTLPARPTASVPTSSNGHANGTPPTGGASLSAATMTNEIPTHLTQILPTGAHPLSGISLRAHLLGVALGLSISSVIYLIWTTDSTLWRLPFFIGTLALFHFLEFYITAAFNTPLARTDAFLLTQNGSAYNAAHTLALLETLLVHWFGLYEALIPDWLAKLWIALGLTMMVVGQAVRSTAMATAGTNFNHTVQWRKNSGHELVTEGIYGLLRHPSYFGFFWWGLGTQVVLGNVLCLIGYAGVLWKFFQMRIQKEEQYLIKFFGEDYVKYRTTTGVGIPFIH